jgi:cyanophycinase-like exopeptidase
MSDQVHHSPGSIVLFGSGETSPTGRKIFDRILKTLPPSPLIALLETPSGFELNSHRVIGRVGEFFEHHLQNYTPHVEVIPARKRGTPYGPDSSAILAPLLLADMIFMGPGSPSYAVRQLRTSLAWYYVIARHQLGAALALASAAAVAISAYSLPVYEIYKVGEDLHWIEGLNLFGLHGLKLVFIPHWNNHEGGEELDTSRCFMGQLRFSQLLVMLPEETTIVGLDEKTALLINPATCVCHVLGLGLVTLLHTGHSHRKAANADFSTGRANNTSFNSDEDLAELLSQRGGHTHRYQHGERFPLADLGPFHPGQPELCLPQAIWQTALLASQPVAKEVYPSPPDEVQALIQSRQKARLQGNWQVADNLRVQIANLGWEVVDTKDGPMSRKLPEAYKNKFEYS